MRSSVLQVLQGDPEAAISAQPEVQDRYRKADLLQEPEAWRELLEDRTLGQRASVLAARRCPNAYAEYVFDFVQANFHVALQDIVTRFRKVSIDAPVEHAKTTQLTVIRSLWDLGQDPSHQIAIIGNSTTIPYRALGQIRLTLEENPRHREVFPDLELVRSTNETLEVRRPRFRTKDPSVSAMGILGSIVGGRFSIINLDDILSPKNVIGVSRERVWQVIQDVILRRLLWGGSLRDVGTPWFDDDARHKLRRRPGWVSVTFDAEVGDSYLLRDRENPKGTRIPIPDAEPGDTLWTETYLDPESGQRYGWPKDRLEEVKAEMVSAAYIRQLRCRTLSSVLSIFPPQNITRALELGRGRGVATLLDPIPGLAVLTGIDLATRKSKQSHQTVMVTGQTTGGRVRILDIRAGHWEQPGIAREIRTLVGHYANHAGFWIEDNAAQVYLVQLMRDRDALRGWGWSDVELARLRVAGSTTTSASKHDEHLGVRAMTKEFEHDRLELPSDEQALPLGEVENLVEGLLNFDPDPAAHTSDYVMALWLFLQACRSGAGGRDYGIGSRR